MVELVIAFRQKERRFLNVLQQLVLMNNNIQAVQCRIDRAARSHRRSFRFPQRLRLLTLERVRDMFIEYVIRVADHLDNMVFELKENHDIDWQDISNW